MSFDWASDCGLARFSAIASIIALLAFIWIWIYEISSKIGGLTNLLLVWLDSGTVSRVQFEVHGKLRILISFGGILRRIVFLLIQIRLVDGVICVWELVFFSPTARNFSWELHNELTKWRSKLTGQYSWKVARRAKVINLLFFKWVC